MNVCKQLSTACACSVISLLKRFQNSSRFVNRPSCHSTSRAIERCRRSGTHRTPLAAHLNGNLTRHGVLFTLQVELKLECHSHLDSNLDSNLSRQSIIFVVRKNHIERHLVFRNGKRAPRGLGMRGNFMPRRQRPHVRMLSLLFLPCHRNEQRFVLQQSDASKRADHLIHVVESQRDNF